MEEKKSKAHLFNLNFDPQLSGRLVHIFQKPELEIGNKKGKESDICMVGPGLHEQHAIIRSDNLYDGGLTRRSIFGSVELKESFENENAESRA